MVLWMGGSKFTKVFHDILSAIYLGEGSAEKIRVGSTLRIIGPAKINGNFKRLIVPPLYKIPIILFSKVGA
jgi:hypothetical protein